MRFALVTLAALSLAAGAPAGGHPGSTLDVHVSADSCAPGSIRLGDGPVEMEKQVIEAADLRSIDVRHSPLTIVGGSGSGYTITVCKAASSLEALSQIDVAVHNGRLETKAPKSGRWVTTYHIRAPREALLDVQAENGPVSIKDYDGTISTESSNGPLTLRNVAGKVDARTTNGPISVSGASGDVKLRVTNGPLTVNLEGNLWKGAGLDASSENGPLSLSVPRGYGSRVVVEASGSGPIACDLDECAGLNRLPGGGESRRVEIGRGVQNVRLSTANGPVVINEN